MHDIVDDGRVGYARYVFSYQSKLKGSEGRRALFEGVSVCSLKDGRIASYHEVANAAVGMKSLGMAAEKIDRFLGREAAALAARAESAHHLA